MKKIAQRCEVMLCDAMQCNATNGYSVLEKRRGQKKGKGKVKRGKEREDARGKRKDRSNCPSYLTVNERSIKEWRDQRMNE
jgi:hypothetical protein